MSELAIQIKKEEINIPVENKESIDKFFLNMKKQAKIMHTY